MHTTVFTFFLLLVSIHHIVGTVRLTKTPPATIFAFVGETVRFNWDYTVSNKDLDFGYYVSSPIWYYYKPNGEKSVIAVEDGLHNWKWKISDLTCPQRLLHPTVRVSKESVATLVISNVNKSDSGWYGISLEIRTSPSITNKVQLVVTGEAIRFTKVPPRFLFVAKEKTARFEWNHSYNNRNIEFQEESPLWGYIDQNNQWATIATAKRDQGQGWKVSLNTTTCPARLLNPTRVHVEPLATLVILNVTMADSGTYGISLKVKWGPSITNTVQLVVTEYPEITSPTLSSMIIHEGSGLELPCLSRGLPTPNVTWVRVAGNSNVFISKGKGKAMLRIQSINRNQSGIYECHASNNPNEVPVMANIKIIVVFVKQIVSFNSIKRGVKRKNMAEGMDFRLTCSANFSMNAVNITYTWRRENDTLTTSKRIHNFSMNAVNVTYTWTHTRGNKKLTESKRMNNAELLMYNISRDEAGTYECLASTSRMNVSITANITVVVTVLYKPEIDNCLSSRNKISSFSGYTIHLRCVAKGVPVPNITWYASDGKLLSTGTTSYPGGSELTLTLTRKQDYGMYRCRAENTIGDAWHNITVMQICPCKGNYKKYKTSAHGKRRIINEPVIFIAWLAFTIVSGIVNILLVIYIKSRKHQKRKDRTIVRQEKQKPIR